MLRVEFDRHSLKVNGVRKLIRSGSLHYFRLPAQELWRDRLEKMRQAGLNAVDLYYPWNYHSEAPGDYDFTGIRDLDVLHQMIEDAGLYLIARPGPYICAEIDLGGIPGWLARDADVLLRCRSAEGFSYSGRFLEASHEWFAQVVPRFATRPNLILVQIENEYSVPGPLAGLRGDLVDLLIRWFGARALFRLGDRLGLVRRASAGPRNGEARGANRGQTSPYMSELYGMVRELGVQVPIFHNDIFPHSGRQMDVDLLALDRYPITSFDTDWREDPTTFDGFLGDEAALAAHRSDVPVFYPELQGGWYDGWGGGWYDRIREVLGPEAIDNVTKAALVERATLWNYYVFCGGVTWGYMSSPDVYSSYDYAAPIAESGRTGARYEAVRRLNEFLDRFEEDLAETERESAGLWCDEHLLTRSGPSRRFVFLRNPTTRSKRVPTPEAERSELAPWETQIRVYGPDGRLEAVSPEVPPGVALEPATPPPLPRLERWQFAGSSPQLDPAYDDSSWEEISQAQADRGCIDMDALGIHYGFAWYRGTFHRPLDRLLLDARHCYAVWINRRLVAVGDQFRNPLGVGPDGARRRRIRVPPSLMNEGRNVLVILVESLGHNKGFADDGVQPRGIAEIDTGATPISWRFRGGLVRGERGLTPVVAFEAVERTAGREVVLPHGWEGDPEGVGLYDTTFQLEGVDPKSVTLGLSFDPGRGKANLYLNGHLIGRYWPERGPQRTFLLPWGVLQPDGENRLAIAVWKRSRRAALGKVRLEVM